jgi:hypothetical protein
MINQLPSLLKYRLLSSLSLFITLFCFTLTAQKGMEIQILDNSQLFIEGKSNINKFACHCTQNFPTAKIQYNSTPSKGTAHFNKTEMKITTSELDCGKKAINKDLLKTLKADEYPNIILELCSLKFMEGAHDDEWQEVKAETFLTIAGTTRTMNMMVKAKQLGQGTFKIKSSEELKLTDFGIDPPTALLGLVKVKDEMTLHLDLEVKINLPDNTLLSQRNL